MKSKKLNLFVLSAFCLGLITVALPVFSYAQDDEAVYTRRYSRRNVADTIARLEQSSNAFRRDFDRYLDESNINGTNEEGRINRTVQNFERALNVLRREFDASNNWWQTRNDVRKVMDEARQVNNMMNNLSFARRLERQWNQMRRDINSLAQTYNLPNLSGGGGGGGGGGVGGGNAPSWAVGRFYGRNPQTGGTISLDINSRGVVTITFENGNTEYASINGDRLNNNGIVSRVSRITNGIRTTRIDNGERIDYFTSGNNTGGGNGGGAGGNVPDWAVGRFYGRNPQTGGTITLDINRDGSVIITFENGATNYATMDNDRLTNNGVVSRVTRLNNGIRTTRIDNGERIDYRR